MAFNYNKLKGRIVEICGSQSEFAKLLGVSKQTVTAKLNNRSNFSQNDIIKWCEILQIDQSEIGKYFFAH